MMTLFRCPCRCHDADIYGVPVTDVVEAAIACDYCKNDHTEVFREPYKPPTDWKPSDDQADGEGKETL